MGKFTKNHTIKGVYKNIMINDGEFVDFETGETVDIVGELSSVYGQNAFDIATSLKVDEEVTL